MTDPTHEPTTEPTTDTRAELEDVVAAVATTPVAPGARGRRLGFSLSGLRRIFGGMSAIGAKELRGRMRGRRAFVILTIYLVLLGGFAWMIELLMERSYSAGFGSSAAYASASIGQGIFAALMFLETLQVVFLAPAATAGAISLEREKQTLEMLITTPISSVAIVVGKLLSALTYVFLLILASVPLTAVVFVYGGVAPDDVLRGYAVLVVTAIGLGSFGLFCSSLVRRTQAATAISIFGVLAISVGTAFLLIFWTGIANTGDGQGMGPIRGRSPEVIAYLNPFIAQADVMCGTETSTGGWCSLVNALVPSQNGVIFTNDPTVQPAVPVPAGPGVGVGGGSGGVLTVGGALVPVAGPITVTGTISSDVNVVDSVRGIKRGFVNGAGFDTTGAGVAVGPDAPFGVVRDTLWPKMVVTWIILSAIFLLLSIQLVSPTRRWRPGRQRQAKTETPT